jgi:hypothetical protein
VRFDHEERVEQGRARRFCDEVITEHRYDKLPEYACEAFIEETLDLSEAGQEQGLLKDGAATSAASETAKI